jgi:hypothetical protein
MTDVDAVVEISSEKYLVEKPMDDQVNFSKLLLFRAVGRNKSHILMFLTLEDYQLEVR